MNFNVDKNIKSEGLTPTEPNLQKNEVELAKLRQEAVNKLDPSVTSKNGVNTDSLEKIGIISVISEALTNLSVNSTEITLESENSSFTESAESLSYSDLSNQEIGKLSSKQLETTTKKPNYGSIDHIIDNLLKELDSTNMPTNDKEHIVKPMANSPIDKKIETITPKIINTLHGLPNFPPKFPPLPQTPYEKDMKIIQNWLKTPEGKTCLLGVDRETGERVKFSRSFITDLTHSYLRAPDGRFIQQLHKTNGIGLAHHVKDSKKSDHSDIVKGEGGFKKAMGMTDGHEGITDIRAVVHRQGADLSNAIRATKNPIFKNCEKLMVGHYVSYFNARGDLREAFLTSYMQGGDLEDKPLNFKEAISVSLQIAQGLQVVHDEGWAHLDIKPGNIFVQDKKDYLAKLADFDLAKDRTNLGVNKRVVSGTPGYMSPQMMRMECYGLEGAQHNDIYALGISMLEFSGFSIWNNFMNDLKNTQGKTEKQILMDFNEFIKKIKPNSPEYKLIKSDFEKFKNSLAPLKSYEEDHLNLAWSMINPDPKMQPSIRDIALDLFSISIDSTV